MGELQRYDFVPERFTASEFDFDYTKDKETGFSRGGRQFNRPRGWIKIALDITGKYENDAWFAGIENRKDEKKSVEGEWPVSYHGPKDHRTIAEILSSGYDISKNTRSQYGKGIYSSPNPATAEGFAKTFNYNGKQIKAMFMNRVHMSYTNVVHNGNIYVTTNDRMIRPIAVLIKEV